MNRWPAVSKSAARRLAFLSLSGAIVVSAAGLTLAGLRSSISYFYTPTQALAQAQPGTPLQLGGLVERGSFHNIPQGGAAFRVRDQQSAVQVVFRGQLPDLFREGQGVVATGTFVRARTFSATALLAKHDERYLPRPLAAALKDNGRWNNGSSVAQ